MEIKKAKYLLDSVILIDHLNGWEEATSFLDHHRERCAISVITRAEILSGYEEEVVGEIQLFLDHFPLLEVGKESADRAAQWRRHRKVKLPDALQLALAQIHGLSLVTRNTKDLSPSRYPFVLVPYHHRKPS
jgi:predicted nucleic acid-binding protein